MITVNQLTKSYGRIRAIDDLSFQIEPGRVTGFVGPNGAGKSTTMRAMVGLVTPDSGEVRYGGIPYHQLSRPVSRVGAVLDAACMHPGRTARNHLRALAATRRVPAAQVDAVLAEVGLDPAADRRAGSFSLGMRQRLALAAALLGGPEILLLDEPSNGLDPDGIRWLRGHLRSFADRGGTVLVSSHLIAELAMFADDLVVIGAGRLLAADTIEAISRRGERVVAVQTPQRVEFATLLAGHGLDVRADDHGLLVHCSTRADIAQIALDHRIRIDQIVDRSDSLEDVLLALTNHATRHATHTIADDTGAPR